MSVSSIPSFVDTRHLTLIKASQTGSENTLVAKDPQGDTLTLNRQPDPNSGSLPVYTLGAVYAQAGSSQVITHESISDDEAGDLASAVAGATSAPDLDLSAAGFLIAELNTRGGFGGAAGSSIQ